MRAWVCDSCRAVLIVNDRGDDENGESSAWIRVGTLDGGVKADACTRSCAVALLADGESLAEAIETRLQATTEVVRILRNESGDDE